MAVLVVDIGRALPSLRPETKATLLHGVVDAWKWVKDPVRHARHVDDLMLVLFNMWSLDGRDFTSPEEHAAYFERMSNI